MDCKHKRMAPNWRTLQVRCLKCGEKVFDIIFQCAPGGKMVSRLKKVVE